MLPEASQFLDDEIRLLFEDRVAALLDDAALCGSGDRFGASKQWLPKGVCPAEHRHRELGSGKLAGLLGHLRKVTVEVEACAQVRGLTHLCDVVLYFILGNGGRVVGKIAKKVPQILFLAASTRYRVMSMFMCMVRCQ